jgi:hypothetical protein
MANELNLIKNLSIRPEVLCLIIGYQEGYTRTRSRPCLLNGKLELLPPVLDNWETCNRHYQAFSLLEKGFEWLEFSFRLDQYLPIECVEPIFNEDENVLADFTEKHGLQVYTPPMILWFDIGNHPDSRSYNHVMWQDDLTQKEIRILGTEVRPWVVFDYWPVRQAVKDFFFNTEKPTEGIFAIETKTDGTITCHIINRDGTVEPEFTVIDQMMLKQPPKFDYQTDVLLLPESQRQLQVWAGIRLKKIKFFQEN